MALILLLTATKGKTTCNEFTTKYTIYTLELFIFMLICLCSAISRYINNDSCIVGMVCHKRVYKYSAFSSLLGLVSKWNTVLKCSGRDIGCMLENSSLLTGFVWSGKGLVMELSLETVMHIRQGSIITWGTWGIFISISYTNPIAGANWLHGWDPGKSWPNQGILIWGKQNN